MPDKVLLLGGTGEGAALARRLAADPSVDLTVSFAGRVAHLPDLPGRVRVGGFGGVDGLMMFLRQEGISRVIDATHPFAAAISDHAALACARLGVTLERVDRPLWPRHPGDCWHWADDMAMAGRLAAGLGRRIFLTSGRGSLAAFSRHGGPFYLIRLIDPPTKRLAFPDHAVVLGRGPFTKDQEIALMRRFSIDLLVTKASGGAATAAKLAAARHLAIPVVLIKRPDNGRANGL